MKITLTTPYVSTNRLYTMNRNGSRRKTYAGLAVAKEMAKEAWGQRIGPVIETDVFVLLELFMPDNRRRDVDNTKGILDSMSKVLWEDDTQITDLYSRKRIDKENPRVELTVLKSYDSFIKSICNLSE